MHSTFSFLAALAVMVPFSSSAAGIPALVPLPAKVEPAEGRFKLDASTSVVAPAALGNEAKQLAARLRATSGFPVPAGTSGTGITLALDPKLPEEGYALEISPSGVAIRGGTAAGVFYGTQTFLQTLPPAVYGREPAPQADWSAPALKIEDAPNTTWRGLHLDSARHFQPKAFILKFLDAMAAQKLNRLHWHLVDSEGWRLEIKKYPKLTEVSKNAPAYFPEEIPTNPTFRAKYRYGHLHGGGFYSQDDVREIVAYAAKLHIVIVPEIEFPGHAMAALTAYPEIGTSGIVPSARSNITQDLIGVHPKAISFLKDVLDETMALFPGTWIHFGGDEAPKNQWKGDAFTQKKIDELHLRVTDPKNANASEDALQGWLFNEMAEHVAKKGRKAVGWEEIMHGDNIDRLTKGSVIMPWLSVNNGAKAANAGFGVVHTSVGPFYLDSYQSKDPGEPSTLYAGPITVENIHRFNLFPDGLTPEGRKNILGAQAQLWSELMPRTDDVEYQAYPRACALAELTWTAPERRADTEDFMIRLAEHGARLTALGLNHRRVSPPASLKWTPEFLAGAKDWVSPLPSDIVAKLNQGETLVLNFEYQSGTHGLDISAVELLADGKVLAEDKHAGFTGGKSTDNVYKMKLPAGGKAEKATLRVKAKGRDGTDSRGEIRVSTSH
jgi:hexosaminidase